MVAAAGDAALCKEEEVPGIERKERGDPIAGISFSSRASDKHIDEGYCRRAEGCRYYCDRANKK
jgi:hypothetical protein